MEVGAIGYHDASKVKNLWVVKDKETVKRLDKTKEVSGCAHSCNIYNAHVTS